MEKNLGHATAYGYAKSKGYSGTEEEFAQLMANYASVGQSAAQSAEQAAASATSASGSAATATQAAQTATDKASKAVTAADTATTKASEASASADTASAAATSASTNAQTATTAATTATAKADEAAASEAAALSAKTDAETARDAAAQSASEAAASAESIDPDEFNHKIYAAFATDTASGSIASFADGADDIPMKDVLVHVDPVQDLHGYDSPWPAGGGKNKLQIIPFAPKTMNGITMTYNENGTVTVNGTSTGRFYQYFRTYAADWFPEGKTYTFRMLGIPDSASSVFLNFTYSENGATYAESYGQLTGNGTKTVTSSHPYNSVLFDCPKGQTFNNNKLYINAEEGIAVGDWTPYSNICPITGWTRAKVTRCGKNFVGLNTSPQRYITYTGVTASEHTDNKVVLTANETATYAQMGLYYALPEGIYTASVKTSMSSDSDYNPFVSIYNMANENTLLARGIANGVAVTFTVPKDAIINIRFFASSETAKARTVTFYDFQLELGSIATDYEPYSGQTYDITFPSEAGTVYGGTLNVTKGELVVDRAIIASYAGETLPTTWISDRDVYSEGATPTTGAQVCYKLTTPITYQLTPQEITSLLGTNNLWADTGNSEVEYRADVKLYITKKITEAVSALS